MKTDITSAAFYVAMEAYKELHGLPDMAIGERWAFEMAWNSALDAAANHLMRSAIMGNKASANAVLTLKEDAS